MPLVMPASSASAPSHPLQRAGTVLLASHGLPTLFGAYLVVLSGTNRADSSVVAALSMEVERKRLLPARHVAGTVTWAAASVLLQQVLLQQVLLQQVLLLPTTCLAASPTLACVSNTRNDSFWDHTRCRSGPGTNACCATVWSPTNAAECCKNCRSSAFGFECMAWEWDAAGAACYVCSNEVLPFRGNMSGHTTGVLNLTAAAALPHSGAPLSSAATDDRPGVSAAARWLENTKLDAYLQHTGLDVAASVRLPLGHVARSRLGHCAAQVRYREWYCPLARPPTTCGQLVHSSLQRVLLG